MPEHKGADRRADATVAPVNTQTAPTAAKLSVPIWLDRSAGWAWRLLLIGAVGVAVLWIFSLIRLAVVPFLIATMFAAALQPPIQWLRSHRVPTSVAVTMVFVLSLLLLIGPAVFAVQSAAVELTHVDDDYARVRAEVDRWLMEGPLGLSREEITKAEETIRDNAIGGIRRFGSSRISNSQPGQRLAAPLGTDVPLREGRECNVEQCYTTGEFVS